MGEIQLQISEDEAIVLFEFFERFGEQERLYFVHPAEYISLMKISALIDKSIRAMFSEEYKELLQKAREKIAKDFESDFPLIEKE